MRRALFTMIVPAALAVASSGALAANGVTEEEEEFDARLAGFSQGEATAPLVIKPASGTAGTWFMTVILGGLYFGAMCKNGKRTHMD